MYGADYAWILQEELGSMWWLKAATPATATATSTASQSSSSSAGGTASAADTNENGGDCSVKQLQAVVENVIIVSSYNRIVGNQHSFSGLVSCFFGLVSLSFAVSLVLYTFDTVNR